MEYFRRYLLTHGEPDGFPRLENDLVFYLEVQKFKVRNIYHLYLITPAKDLKGSLNSACPTNNRNLQGWQEISFLEYLSPIYTAENFRHGSDKSGTRTQKNSTD